MFAFTCGSLSSSDILHFDFVNIKILENYLHLHACLQPVTILLRFIKGIKKLKLLHWHKANLHNKILCMLVVLTRAPYCLVITILFTYTGRWKCHKRAGKTCTSSILHSLTYTYQTCIESKIH